MATQDPGSAHGASPALAVSTVIFSLKPSDRSGRMALHIPLVRRIREPFRGLWALPGGPLGADEDLADAAGRHLFDTTALAPTYLEQLYAFGAPLRVPAAPAGGAKTAAASVAGQRVVSIVYWALVSQESASAAADPGREPSTAAPISGDPNVCWFDADDLPRLAFDHRTIVDYALWRLRSKLEHSRIARGFLAETFTLAQLREVHEAVLGRALDPANFRRGVDADPAVVATGEVLQGTAHRPPKLYRYETSEVGLGADPAFTTPPQAKEPA